jgi:hypothetical protein
MPRQAECIDRVRTFMEPSGQERPLVDFIASLKFDDARDCMSAYFGLENEYLHSRAKFVTVFGRLAVHTLAKGDVYFALHTEVLIGAKGTPWERHYRALSGKQKTAVDLETRRQKAHLTLNQRHFLEWFALYMKKQSSADRMYKFVSASRFEPRRDCLFAYIEVSEAYPERDGPASVLVFERLSRVTIDAGDASFAHFYDGRIHQADSPWHARFQALVPGAQSAINADVARKQVIRSDVTVGDKTFKNAPIGKYTSDPVAPERVDPAEREKQALLTAPQQKYIALYRQYVADGRRESMDALQTFFRQHPTDIASCMDAYLQDSRSKDDRSLAVFFSTVWEAINKEEPYYAFKVQQLILTPGTIWRDRFRSLDKDKYADRLLTHIAEKRAQARLLDDLKAEYFLKRRNDPTSAALATFEPVSSPEQEALLSKGLSDCEAGANIGSVELWEKGFTAVSGVFGSQLDPLTLYVLLKRCRGRRTLDLRFRYLVCLDGLIALFGLLVRERPTVYRPGFSRAEADLLLAGLDTSPRYLNDFVAQYEYSTRKAVGHDTVAALCKSVGSLHIQADRAKLRLTPMIEAAALTGAVQELWDTKADAVRAIRIPIESRWNGHQELTVAQTIGNFYILWWDANNSTAYVQMNGMDQTVFDIGPARLAAIYDNDATYGQIARDTAHLEVLIPLFFDILGYLPDLVSGGMAGLIENIVFNYLFDKSVAALGLDPTKVQLVMLGLALLKGGRKPKASGEPHGHVEGDFSAIQEKSLGRNASLVDGENRMIDAPDTHSVGHATTPAAGSHSGTGGSHVATDVPTSGSSHVSVSKDAAVAGGVPTLEARATHKEAVALPEHATKDAPSTTVDTPTTTKKETSAPNDAPAPKKADTAAVKEKETPAKPADPPAAAKKETPSKTKTDAPTPAKKTATPAPPPPPPRPSIPDRVPDGAWKSDGHLQVNDGGFEIRDPEARRGAVRPTGSKKSEILVNPGMYENACTQQVFPKMAEKVAGTPVKARAPHQPGFGSRSSLKTTLLKLQKAVRGDILNRRPEGVMEIVEGAGKTARVAEAHFFESTLQKDFRPTTGAPGHKQRQISGTLWITNEIPRKGYTPETKLYYHIASTGPPTPTTVKYLNQVMEEMPNVKISWYVVR